jgi:hypothetical protein
MCYVPWGSLIVSKCCLILIVTAKHNCGTVRVTVWNTKNPNWTVQLLCIIKPIDAVGSKKHWNLHLFSIISFQIVFYLYIPPVNGCAYLIYFCMDINKYNCWNESNVWGVLCKKWEDDDVEERTDVAAGWSVQRQRHSLSLQGTLQAVSTSCVHKLCPLPPPGDTELYTWIPTYMDYGYWCLIRGCPQ